MKKKDAFFMVEILVSIVIITGVLIVLFTVKDNSIVLVSKMDQQTIHKSLLPAFIPYTQKSENQTTTLADLYDFKHKKLQEQLGKIQGKNSVVKNDKSIIENPNSNILNLLPKEVIITHGNYKKSFYSFTSE